MLTLTCPAYAAKKKTESTVNIFHVDVKSSDEFLGKKEIYLYKEWLITTNQAVNAELSTIVDDMCGLYQQGMQKDPRKNAKRNSRLDVHTVYSHTGQSWLSALILARVSFERNQLKTPFTTRTYDLKTGNRIYLTDVFPADSEAWAILAQGVRDQLTAAFPNDTAAEGMIDALCTREALEKADFTLGPVELALHYETSTIYPKHNTILHVRFYYPDFEGMMTAEATRQTDISQYKLITITCDDGPNYTHSILALNAMRQAGFRANYFVVGKVISEFVDVLIREADENNIIGNHSYSHSNGHGVQLQHRMREYDKTNDLIVEAIGVSTPFFRSPLGTYPPWIEAGMPVPIIQWDLVTYDFKGKSAQAIAASVRKAEDGSIILMHDTGDQMYKSIPLIAKWAEENGFLIVTLDELARAKGVKMQPNVVYYGFTKQDVEDLRENDII